MNADAELWLPGRAYSLAGIDAPSISRYLRKEAKRESSAVVAVEQKDENGRLIGVVVAIQDLHRYRLKLLLRFPMIGVSAVWRRLWAKPKTQKACCRPDLPFPERWSNRGRNFAHVVLIIVEPQHRCRGIGARLYSELFAKLARRGVTRVIAHVDIRNESSLALHRRTGWIVGQDHSGFLCVKRL